MRPTPPRRQLKTAQSVSKDASDTEPEEQDTSAPQQKSGKILRFYETTPTYDPHKTKPEFIQPNRPPYQFNIPYCNIEGPFTHDNLLTFNTRYLPNPELLKDSYTFNDTFNNSPEHNLKWEYWKKDTMEDLEEIAGPDYEKFPQLIGQFKQWQVLLALGYQQDEFFKNAIANALYGGYTYSVGILYQSDTGKIRICIPDILDCNQHIKEITLKHAYEGLIHRSFSKIYHFMNQHYYWPKIPQDILEYCRSYPTCQRTKSSTQRPYGLLKPLPIPN